MTHHQIPQAVNFDASVYSRPWQAPEAKPLHCHGHGQPEGHVLCGECVRVVLALLADVPALLHDCELALTRQTEFVDHGTTEDDRDESPLPFDQRASRAIVGLALALECPSVRLGTIATRARLLARWVPRSLANPQVARLATSLADAVVYAQAVVERPVEPWYYGPCPKCRVDIFDERAVAMVSCPLCDYAAPLADHQRACLDAGDDRRLTVTELVGAITTAGEAVTRDQINGWIRRGGLARDRDNRASWRRGVLVSEAVWVYRLGDVRCLAHQSEGWRDAS